MQHHPAVNDASRICGAEGLDTYSEFEGLELPAISVQMIVVSSVVAISLRKVGTAFALGGTLTQKLNRTPDRNAVSVCLL
jgi:hypothetical protein